jgi:hypothetical protein
LNLNRNRINNLQSVVAFFPNEQTTAHLKLGHIVLLLLLVRVGLEKKLDTKNE